MQNQHKVPQTYLKEFGYQTVGGHWKISTLDVSKFKLMQDLDKLFFSQKSIETVTAEYDIFNLDDDPEFENHFEVLNCQLETHYPKIVSDLRSEGQLSPISEGVLVQLVPNLICRSAFFREFIEDCLQSELRDNFLKEATTFHNDNGAKFIKIINASPVKNQTNLTCMIMMEHIMEKLAYFNYAIISEYDGRGWLTSDHPVTLEDSLTFDSIFSVNTEIYFPISRDFCAFFYHPNSESKNLLRELPNKSLTASDEITQELIYEKVRANAKEFIFFPYKINSTSSLKKV